MRTYRYITEEGLKIEAKLLERGVQDEGIAIEDWFITVSPSTGYSIRNFDAIEWRGKGEILFRTEENIDEEEDK